MTENTKTATFVRDVSKQNGATGVQRLYKLAPAIVDESWDGETTEYEHVIVSATVVPFGGGPETYIFPATEGGEIASWRDLTGSYQGGLDHAEALVGAGYEVSA